MVMTGLEYFRFPFPLFILVDRLFAPWITRSTIAYETLSVLV